MDEQTDARQLPKKEGRREDGERRDDELLEEQHLVRRVDPRPDCARNQARQGVSRDAGPPQGHPSPGAIRAASGSFEARPRTERGVLSDAQLEQSAHGVQQNDERIPPHQGGLLVVSRVLRAQADEGQTRGRREV